MKNSYLPYLYVLLIFLVVRFIVGFDGLYGQDSYEYLRYSKRMLEFLLGGEHPGNYFWGVGFPLLIGVVSLSGLSVLSIIQIVNLLSLLGIVFFAKKIIQEIYEKEEGLPSIYLLITLSSPYLIQSSLVAMTDILTTFCVMGGFYFGLKYLKNYSFKALLAFAFFTCYAVFTRYASALPLLFIGIYVIIAWVKSRKWSQVLVLIVPAMLVVLHLYFKQNSNNSIISHGAIIYWDFKNIFFSNFDTDSGHFNFFLSNIFYVFSPFLHLGFLAVGTVLLPFYIVKLRQNLTNRITLLVASSILIYGLFLAGIPFQNKRFLLLTFPLIVIFLYPSFQLLTVEIEKLKFYRKQYAKFLIVGLLLMNVALTAYVIREIAFKINYPLNDNFEYLIRKLLATCY